MMGANADGISQQRHAVLVTPTGEEESRQLFVKSLKSHLAEKVAPGNRIAFETRAKPSWIRVHGSEPKGHHAIRKAMLTDPYYQMWSAMQRNSQEMMWRSIQLTIERELDDLKAKARVTGETLGSLTLDQNLEIPAYHTTVDIHCMPGGYHTEFTEDDVTNGAMYDRGVWLYSMGRVGPLNDDLGWSVGDFLKAHHPDFKPSRVLDMGCAIGNATLPYVDLFPDAEVYGIDVAAPLLRYGHARAESLRKAVHFSQQNAERTNFEDSSFDLIVSHLLVHETSNKSIRTIMKEANRLLRPGGILVHVETPPYADLPDFDAFMLDWDTYNSNEPFLGGAYSIDPAAIVQETGFGADSAFGVVQPSARGVAEHRKANSNQAGNFGGAAAWYMWGARKAVAK
jgi:SAM-dependent methyltransferase